MQLFKHGMIAALLLVVLYAFWGEDRAPSSGKIVVKYAIWGGVSEEAAWHALEDAFEKRHPDIDLVIQLVPAQYEHKMLAMLAARTAPDLVNLPIADFASKGVWHPIDDYLAQGDSLELSYLFDGMLSLGRWKGVQYDIPPAIGPQVLYYNKDFFRKAGLEDPNDLAPGGEWTWDRFVESAKALTVRNADDPQRTDRWGFVYYPVIETYIFIQGPQPCADDYSECYYDQPEVFGAIQNVADLMLGDEPVGPPPELDGQLGSWQAFKRGYAAMFISGPWQVARLDEMEWEYDIAPPPLNPGGRTATLGGFAMGIWKHSKVKDEAHKWQRFLATREARSIWGSLGFDIPATHWHRDHIEEWADTSMIPEHFHLFYDLIPGILKPPVASRPFLPKRAADALTTAWEAVRAGRRTAEDAFTEANAKVNLVIARGY